MFVVIYSNQSANTQQLNAFRVEEPQFIVKVSGEGQVYVEAGQDMVLRMFSSSQPFGIRTQVSFTNIPARSGTVCDDLRITEIRNVGLIDANSALVTVNFQSVNDGDSLMFCLRRRDDLDNTSSSWIHQGNSTWLQVVVVPDPHQKDFLPSWAKSIIAIVFLCVSGVFSGLALVLLSLTKSELKVLRNHGTSKERHFVKALVPLRKRGNYLLCTILLMNTLANVVVTVLLFELIGFYTLIVATFSIIFIGEILPQTVCSWCGLLIGTKTVWFTNIFLILTFPISYPVSKLMDLLLANEIPTVYNRDRLLELLKSSNTENEAKVGKAVATVDLSTKCVRDIMTKLEDVYMVEYNSTLTSEMLNQILKTGFTRVPVYESDRTNIVALLHVKDLALLDPDGKTSLKTLCKFYNHPVNFVFEDTKLNVMLEEFKKGQSHMAFIQHVNSEGTGDPFYETLGMVTLEDVIEDIFQSEISDESTVILDNKELMTNLKKLNMGSFPMFSHEKNDKVSSKQLLAARSYLSSSVAQFHSQWISEKVLEHLIEQSPVINVQPSDPSASCCIYEAGKISDFFVLILDGNVQIDIGKEHFAFTEGPFSFFGLQILTDAIDMLTSSITLGTVSEKITLQQSQYVPDFTLRAVTDVQFLRIGKSMYFAALRATLLQHQQRLAAQSVELCPPGYNTFAGDLSAEIIPRPNDSSADPRLYELYTSSKTKLLA